MERTPRLFFTEHEIPHTEVAGWLGVQPPAISRKLTGVRRWTEDEIKILLAHASAKLGRQVTFEEMFGAPAEVPHAR